MLELLVCSVVLMGNGIPAAVETEKCSLIKTAITVETACLFAGGSFLAADRYLTFCRVANGRVKP